MNEMHLPADGKSYIRYYFNFVTELKTMEATLHTKRVGNIL